MLTQILIDAAKRSKALTNLVHTAKRVRMIDSLQELDDYFGENAERHAVIDDKVIAELGRICFRLKEARLPKDPFSNDYREAMLDIYRVISGRPQYEFDFEAAQFDPETEKFNFFPYNSNSLNLVGTQLITQGLTLRNISLPPEGSIVELGAGQGNTALHLALTGYDVTVVEVNQPSIDLIQYRAKIHGREIRAVRQDMSTFVRNSTEQFDAVLFVASFHHCLDHLELLNNLGKIVKKGGAIYFADEPIAYSESRFHPYPWGLRLDGLSLYFVRRHGWLELGYGMKYFREALTRAGWKLQTIRSSTPGAANFYAARRA